MQKITFVNEQEPALDADNMNSLQSNVEDVFNGDEPMGNIVVEDIQAKNMFNQNIWTLMRSNGSSLSKITDGFRLTTTKVVNSAYNAILLGKDELLGETIVLSANVSSSSTNNGQIYLYYANSSNNNLGESIIGISTGTSMQGASVTTTIDSSFPTGMDCIALLFYSNVTDTAYTTGAYIDYTNIQLEKGSTATNYVDYKAYGIVESGTKNNASWVKYADGTMVCCEKLILSSINVNNSADTGPNLYRSSILPFSDFPVTFTSVPNVTKNGYLSYLANHFCWYTENSDITIQNPGTGIFLSNNSSTGRNGYILYQAIGRWK